MGTASELTRRGAVLCPICKGRLTIHGCYPRHFRDEEGKRHDGWAAQGHCKMCHTYPSLLPDFLMPYKHFKGEVIEAAIREAEEEDEGVLSGCPADDSTIRRWARQFKERGARAVGWLMSILCGIYERHINVLELQSKGLIKQLARLAREMPVPISGAVIGQVNAILTRHNCGFL